jgi:hypothetical protein
MVLQNNGTLLQHYVVSQPRRMQFEMTLLFRFEVKINSHLFLTNLYMTYLLPMSIFDVTSCLISLSSSTGNVPDRILLRYRINS